VPARARKPLGFVPAHHDDAFGTHFPGGNHGTQAHGAVADDHGRVAWASVGRLRAEM